MPSLARAGPSFKRGLQSFPSRRRRFQLRLNGGSAFGALRPMADDVPYGRRCPSAGLPAASDEPRVGWLRVVATRARPDRTIKLVLWFPLASASTNVAHKEGTTFLAEGVLPHGINFALIEYTLSPAVRLDRIVAEVRRAAQWLAEHLGDYGADPARLYVSRPFGGRSSDRLDDVATRCSGRACYQRYLRSRTD